ncbi:hypothetical protein RSAG8_05355, partial [Rhizoctonia solani AG-8 WAC10335]
MNDFFNKIANYSRVRVVRDAVGNLPSSVTRLAKVGMIGVGTGAAVLATPPLLGFTASGVSAGSLAATIQSAVYGASVPAGSLFATIQSVGATTTIAPALIAGAGALGIAGAVEASRNQDTEGNRRRAGDEAFDERDESGDQEKRDEGNEQEFARDEKEHLGDLGNENQTVPTPGGETRTQVANPGEYQSPMEPLLNVGQGEEMFRPRNRVVQKSKL